MRRSPNRDRSHNYKGVYDMILDKVRGSLDWDRSYNYRGYRTGICIYCIPGER